MPTNMYGPRDNFDIETGHVLPALINKFVSAVNESQSKVMMWGDGSPRREFLHSIDLAKAIIIATEKYDDDLHLNVGSGEEISIRELATLVADQTGYQGEIVWDTSKPNGTPRKVLNSDRIKALGWNPEISIAEGIKSTIEWFKENSR
jgi:GDP-L-fucose synthase